MKCVLVEECPSIVLVLRSMTFLMVNLGVGNIDTVVDMRDSVSLDDGSTTVMFRIHLLEYINFTPKHVGRLLS